MVETLTKAKEMAIQGVDDINPNELGAFVQAFEGYLDEIISQAHVKYREQYVFSGTYGNELPFEINGARTAVMTNTNGVTGLVRREVSENRVEQINITGEQAFTENVDVFQTLINIRDAFAAGNQAGVRAEFDNLDASMDQMLYHATEGGKRINRFEVLATRFEFEETQTKSDLSRIQDIDIAETVTMLRAEETSLNAALNVIGRLSNHSLLDYVR
jgi:flagellar hook-associated protein 3 FlgL